MFRELTYHKGKMQASTTVYNNGMIFVTEDDFFRGIMKFILPNNYTIEYKCVTSEYAILKSGILMDKDEKVHFKFGIKQGKLLFIV